MDKERKKWRTIIHIIIDVILFLSRQNFSFHGHREDTTQSGHRENFGSKNKVGETG